MSVRVCLSVRLRPTMMGEFSLSFLILTFYSFTRRCQQHPIVSHVDTQFYGMPPYKRFSMSLIYRRMHFSKPSIGMK